MAGRRERPLDREAGPVEAFAYELRGLRAAAGGPTYREMARRAGYSVTTLAAAAGGDQLPSLPVLLAYAAVCGGDPDEWEHRWQEAARALEERTSPVPVRDDDGATPPYRGLSRYESGDRELFFGRDDLVDQLLRTLGDHRFVILTGASGSGKSSLLRAGLIPRLQHADGGTPRCAGIRILTPGDRPAATHAHALTAPGQAPGQAGVAGAPRPGDTVVVVDQFEELFTLCRDPAERTRFLALLRAACEPGSGLRVIAAVRADFYGHCAEHPHLIEVLREAHLLVGPMTPQELRRAVVGPARAAGLIVERELTARIVEETTGRPGALPLMSHALLETWRRRRGRTLTLEAYEAVGGLHGAVADTAEDAYTRLTPAQATHARRILLRLITPGQGARDTRRPAARAELAAENPQDTAAVLEHLTRARLVTLDGDTADLAHEAVITAWPRLRTWIAEDREGLGIHRRLTEAATAWAELDRDEEALYRGTRLAVAAEWAARDGHTADLNPLERDFLDAGTARRDAEQAAAARRARHLRRLSASLALLLLVVTGVSVIAWQQRRVSEQQREKAAAAQRTSLSRQLAAQSTALLDTDPDLASLLALHAHRTAPTRESVAVVHRAAALRLLGERPVPLMGAATAFSPDLRTLAASGGMHETVLHGTVAGSRRIAHPAYAGSVLALAYSPDGATIAAAGDDGTVRLRNAVSGGLRASLTGHTRAVLLLAFSGDGRTLATTGDDATIRLWDPGSGRVRSVLTPATGPTGGVTALALGPDGGTLVTQHADGTVRLWNTRTGRHTVLTRNAVRMTHPVDVPRHPDEWTVLRNGFPLAFDPSGDTLATSHEDGTVRLWDMATRTVRRTLSEHTDRPLWTVFSPDGGTLATVDGEGGGVRLWDVAGGRSFATLGGHSPWGVTALAFGPDSRTLATTDDTSIRRWNVTRPLQCEVKGTTGRFHSLTHRPAGDMLLTSEVSTGPVAPRGNPSRTLRLSHARTCRTRLALDAVEPFALSPDARTLATADDRGTVRLRNTAGGRSRLILHRTAGPPLHLLFSPDGRTLATGDEDTVRLWDPASGALRATIGAGTREFVSFAFSPDSRFLATGGGGAVRLWDAATGRPGRTLSTSVHRDADVTFSPDGRTLAVTTGYFRDITLLDPASGKVRATSRAVRQEFTSLAFSPDSRFLATGGDGVIRLWDAATGSPGRVLSRSDSGEVALAFSPDSRTLATAMTGIPDITLWDTASGVSRGALENDTRSVGKLSFGPGGRTLAVAALDRPVRVWRTDLPGLKESIARICRAAGRDLTLAERAEYLPGGRPGPGCADRAGR
ncbi:nSTAND1 domain-containing NTPase [Streptomyces yaizuensis]|uniref:XRE family transcriptional regulator n=1 Tax=Streptomyces yaizuensis TaxID=2989713 RepID=A0ABQ5NX75_9ACTN|nr:hypothetical protein [Streptomyces sp. YSPA8]GLF94951.1 XRE family transcriptional regulator [Streptomyces sp. YSPA8]